MKRSITDNSMLLSKIELNQIEGGNQSTDSLGYVDTLQSGQYDKVKSSGEPSDIVKTSISKDKPTNLIGL